jgi:hypothetical protein
VKIAHGRYEGRSLGACERVAQIFDAMNDFHETDQGRRMNGQSDQRDGYLDHR